jgi:hypothetical protein
MQLYRIASIAKTISHSHLLWSTRRGNDNQIALGSAMIHPNSPFTTLSTQGNLAKLHFGERESCFPRDFRARVNFFVPGIWISVSELSWQWFQVGMGG